MNRVRCAIYTRKSSDEGLDQAFNSLDAQREACEAYITSQKHEGWKALPTLYDDGGASGGNLARPALQQLMADVDAGRVDMIVVYKIDRLTRSLADFAKLVDRLDAAGASFVSVTQQFNTSTSMGRLTLNVLLSFAQFEREVTAERIRDKIAASKKKGMWMGGAVPLGYDKADAGLIICKPEAEIVRILFETYLEVGCVRKLKAYADTNQLRTKTRTTKNEQIIEGKPFSRGRLYHLLANPIYAGKIRHKEDVYYGLHEAIISEELWDKVQALILKNTVERKSRRNASNPSPLAGKVFDADGKPLSPSHTSKSGRRYRYYVSKRSNEESDRDWRISATELETTVSQAITSDRTVQIESQRFSVAITLDMVTRVKIVDEVLKIGLKLRDAEEEIQVTAAYTLRRRGVENRIVLNKSAERNPDVTLIKRILNAMDWIDRIKQVQSISELAASENVTPEHIARHISFGYLSPRILNAIATGTQRPDIYASQIAKVGIPAEWVDQDAMFLG